jgi:hypothetical protein
VRINETAAAQAHGQVRMQLAAGAIIVHGMSLAWMAILGGVATASAAAAAPAIPGFNLIPLATGSAKVANDISWAAAAAGLLAYFRVQSTEPPPSR